MIRHLARLHLLLVLLLLVAACAGPPPTPVSLPAPATPTPAEEPPLPTPEPPERVRIAFVGDVLLGGGLDGLLAHHGADYPWRQVAPQLRAADLAIGNLETAVTTGGTPEPNKQFTFRSHPARLSGAARAGMDLWSLANNHSRDYGPEALQETLEHVRKAGMEPVGAGADLGEALQPVIREIGGLRIAVLAVSRVIPAAHWVAWEGHAGVAPGWDPTVVTKTVSEAAARADHVILLVHWGEEVTDHPRQADLDLAEAALDAGATLVVGHHPHVLQGIAWHGPKLVAYSLGNFIFPPVPRPLNQQTGILEVDLDRSGVRAARLVPYVIHQGQPRPAKPDESREILDRLNRLSKPFSTEIDADGLLRGEPPSGRPCPACVK